jgi:hypothetical protein
MVVVHPSSFRLHPLLELAGGRFGAFGRGELERSTADQLRDTPAADALRADEHRGAGAMADGHAQPLQVRLEFAPRDAGHLGADPAEILGLAADGHLVAHRVALAANFTMSRHRTLNRVNDLCSLDGTRVPPSGFNGEAASIAVFARYVKREGLMVVS